MSISLDLAEAVAVDVNGSQDSGSPGALGPVVGEIYTRFVTTMARLGSSSYEQPDALEIFEHIASKRDIVVSGPNSTCLETCAAVPALVGGGLILIIVPNMDTLRRHTHRLKELSLRSASFDLAPSKSDKRDIWELLDRGEVDVLIVSQSRLASKRFRDRLKRRDISLLVVDQAHLMSPWSHRFQPNYRQVGRFVASMTNVPKIAQIWSHQGRVGHDVQRILNLKTPYHGCLPNSSEGLPSIDVRQVANDGQRLAGIQEFIERHGGQGIISTTSIKHLYDTKNLLESLGETLAVLRPGMDEFSIQKIRQAFEGGDIRIVVSLGSFMGTLAQTPGLEFAIYNGMPDSIESLAVDLLSLDSAHSVSVRVINGEKDFYQHRFLIDKSYPDALVLRACFQGAKDVLGMKMATSEEALRAHIKVATPFPEEDIHQCIIVMLREGMLEHVLDSNSDQVFVQLAATPEEESDFWHEYPLRKIDQVARLERVRDFLVYDGDKSRQLRTLLKL